MEKETVTVTIRSHGYKYEKTWTAEDYKLNRFNDNSMLKIAAQASIVIPKTLVNIRRQIRFKGEVI